MADNAVSHVPRVCTHANNAYLCTMVTPPDHPSTNSLATQPGTNWVRFTGFAAQIAANIDIHKNVHYREKGH